MSDINNTTFGWVLFSGIVALGLTSLSGKYFHANSPEAPETPGYFIEGAEEGGGAAAEMTMAAALNMDGIDVSAGEKVFAKCTACHTINQGGANGIGPNLYGIMGKPVGGGVPGFAYSDALASKGGTWDWETMSAWLKSPRAFANGTKMSFAGLSKIEDRAAVALFMNENGSNLAVPEYVEAVAGAAEGEIDGAAEGPGGVEGGAVDAVEAAGAMGDEQPVAEGPPE
ncbi:c-type cytochrome [Parerythrobacter jejuensis]|uniref:C-type cytochrome n=1 Tax=Parerythrobacter jejuensis TaxID=795812 RepID=A0A845AXG5_9SPHN|nr:c-type cytochrome [Parerythrobacter jejuensis]MXP30436.1 c-type cytochrome [Parerythrobacter jejuensis]MXP33196.1 c-type cytochrome [Parerythrobacter jejuensis]